MDRPLVVVPSQEDDATQALIRETLDDAARVVFLPPGSATREATLRAADAILVFAWRITDDEIPLLGGVRVVQSVWAGTDRIPAARLRAAHPEIVVASGSGPNASQVAEHAIGLYLDLAKRISWRDGAMRAGRWTQDVRGQRLAGSRVAVVGYGAIGRRVGRTLAAMDVEVTAVTQHGRLRAKERDSGATHVMTIQDLRGALAAHAGVILALPLAPETRGIVDRAWLEAMPQDGILVNVARGPLIVQSDLLAHLRANPGFRAGLDAWWHYPRGSSEEIREDMRPFLALENVVATPHSAFQVPGAREDMIRAAVQKVASALEQ